MPGKGETARKTLTELTLWGVFNSSVTGIAIIDIDGKFAKTNEEFNSILGHSETALQEYSFVELTHPEDKEACVAYWQNSLAGGPATLRSEKRYLHKSGSAVWVALNVVLIKDAHNRPVHFIAQIDDITERKRIADQLIEREEQLRVFAEHSPASQVMLDRDMCYLALSDRCKKDYGIADIPNEELYGKCHYDMFPAFPQHWKDINSRCLAGAVERSDEEAYIGPDGQTHWMTYEVRPWHKASGDIGGIIVFTESITRIKEAELKFRSLVEKSMVGVYIIQNGIFSYINPKLAAIFGYSEEEMTGMPVEKFLHPNYKRNVTNALVTGTPGKEATVNFEAKGLTKHGEVLWFETFGSNTLYNGTAAIIGTLIDITGRKKNEGIIKEKINQLEAITNNLPDVVVYQLLRENNGNRRFLYVSDGIERITGLSAAETLQQQHMINLLIDPHDNKTLQEAEFESYKKMDTLQHEINMVTYKGEKLEMYVRALPRVLENGTVVWDGTLSDITDMKRTAKDLFNKNIDINESITIYSSSSA
ncbi:MAG: PAS domain S-box protein [Chitinophagaceae bacterium]|nr:MAG: PAS domain S-box protein [Chitinophagaceae bacterium]